MSTAWIMREAINGTQFLFLLKEAKPTLENTSRNEQKKRWINLEFSYLWISNFSHFFMIRLLTDKIFKMASWRSYLFLWFGFSSLLSFFFTFWCPWNYQLSNLLCFGWHNLTWQQTFKKVRFFSIQFFFKRR